MTPCSAAACLVLLLANLVPATLVPAGTAVQSTAADAGPAAPAVEPPFQTKTKIMPDGVTMTADWYSAEKARTAGEKARVVFVCCHMARSSRGEYREIAPRLTALGWDVLAIDQRSGEKFGGVLNETAKHAALALGGTQGFQATYGDLGFAVDWARELAPGAKVVLMGSSYSASLALRQATSPQLKADLVLAFSPSECLNDWAVAQDCAHVRVPVLVTCGSGEKERKNAEPIAQAVPEELRHVHWPPDAAKAKHGAQALLVADPAASAAVWKAVRDRVLALAKRE